MPQTSPPIDRRAVVSTALAAAGLAACRQGVAAHAADAPPPASPVLPDLTSEARKLQQAGSAFGAALLEALRGPDAKQTVVVSPLSVLTALAMLGQGARGATAANLADGLKLAAQGLSLADAAAGCQVLGARLASSGSATASMANGLWVSPRVHLRPAFAAAEAKRFAAPIATLDFANPSAADSINRFVSDATHGKIPSIVSNLDPTTPMVLVDALYFKGAWDTPFPAAATKPAPFTRGDGVTIQTPTMTREAEFAYAETGAFQSVLLPYADDRFRLTVILPKPGAPTDAWAAALDTEHDERHGQVFLPRLDLTWGAELTGVLASIGLGVAMGASADYGLAADTPLVVGAVEHKTLLIVDEQGAEAAAATAIITETAAMPMPRPPKPPFVFRADRPFYLALREDGATPLFFAYIAAPTAA